MALSERAILAVSFIALLSAANGRLGRGGLGGNLGLVNCPSKTYNSYPTIPSAFDLRVAWPQCMSPILDQGQCGRYDFLCCLGYGRNFYEFAVTNLFRMFSVLTRRILFLRAPPPETPISRKPRPFVSRPSFPAPVNSARLRLLCLSVSMTECSFYSCWAFSAAQTLTERFCIQSNNTVKRMLSPQDMVQCSKTCQYPLLGKNCNAGCNGGTCLCSIFQCSL